MYLPNSESPIRLDVDVRLKAKLNLSHIHHVVVLHSTAVVSNYIFFRKLVPHVI
jgi:hypothetical protein